jgi:tyrosinase
VHHSSSSHHPSSVHHSSSSHHPSSVHHLITHGTAPFEAKPVVFLSSGTGLRIRKNLLTLTPAQQAKLVHALLSLKATGKYDSFVTLYANSMKHITPFVANGSGNGTNNERENGHRNGNGAGKGQDANAAMLYRNAAHGGPAFFPWHRELILRLEHDLAEEMAEPDFGMPYWNWAAESALAPGASPVWSEHLMGGDGDPAHSDRVRTGPFRSVLDGGTWTTVEQDIHGNPLRGGVLRRTLGRGTLLGGMTLPSPASVSAALSANAYDVPDFSIESPGGFRNACEGWIPFGMNNLVHVWVGGSMETTTSPSDPVFFLHHCNVDRLWNLWQTSRAGGFGRGFVPLKRGPSGHNLSDAMFPWNTASDMRTPADLVNTLSLGYKYDTD